MKTASAALIQLLENGSFVQADLLTFNLVGGGSILITSADVDVAYGGQTWKSSGPYADTPDNKATGHWKVGLDVDTWIVEITPRNINPVTGDTYPDQIAGQPFLSAVRAGALDGAFFQVDRAYWPSWPTPWTSPLAPGAPFEPPADYVLSAVFAGQVSQIDLTRVSALITVSSHLELLTNMMPRNLYQAGCAHQLFDVGCTLAASDFVQHGFITGIGTTKNLISGSITTPGGSATYALGRIVMTSGAAKGYSRAVRSWDGTVFTLIAPMPFDVAVGDTFDAYPGCDKLQSTCTKFNNVPNFGGETYIPVPETAV